MNYKHALQDKQFHIYFQPKIDNRTHQLIGAEALTRLVIDDIIYPPATFLPTVESEGLSDDFGEYVITHALADFKAWHTASPHLRLSVNVSPSQLKKRTATGQLYLKQVIKESLQCYQLPASCLELEITEGEAVDEHALILALKELKTVGLSIVLDDVGKGFNDFTRFHDLVQSDVLDGFKIDKSFIMNIHAFPSQQAFVSSFIRLGESLQLVMTAEGVETEEDIQWLNKTACNQLQGYFYHPPLPKDVFESTYNL